MDNVYFVLFMAAVALWLLYSSKQKKKRQQAKTDYFALEQISEVDLMARLPFEDFEILNKVPSYQLSELQKGHYQGFEFVMFLYSYSSEEGQCFRQTVTAIKLDQKLDSFIGHDDGVWVESHDGILVVYQEKQSMTCGAPIELFLNRAGAQSKSL